MMTREQRTVRDMLKARCKAALADLRVETEVLGYDKCELMSVDERSFKLRFGSSQDDKRSLKEAGRGPTYFVVEVKSAQ
jgi:hypothetical protein